MKVPQVYQFIRQILFRLQLSVIGADAASFFEICKHIVELTGDILQLSYSFQRISIVYSDCIDIEERKSIAPVKNLEFIVKYYVYLKSDEEGIQIHFAIYIQNITINM